MLMKGKKGLIVGVANKMSIAYGIAEQLKNAGAQLAFTYLNDAIKKRVEPIATELGSDKVYELDVNNPSHVGALAPRLEKDFGKIDFVLHAVAFAPKEALENDFLSTSKEAFDIALGTSVYSLVSLTRAVLPVLNGGASILTLSYLGGPKFVPHYNVMGVAKAALESSVRYLASNLGKDGIRVNAISAGPIKTLSAKGIKDFSSVLTVVEEKAPLHRNVTIEQVGNVSTFLLSNMSESITGQILYADSGYNIMGI